MEKNEFVDFKNYFYFLTKVEKYLCPKVPDDVAMHAETHLVLVMIKCWSV